MKVSGFTFVRNAIDLYYPLVESITSILPICAGPEQANAWYPDLNREFDCGQLHGHARFAGTHPAVMRSRIAAKDWDVRPGTSIQRHYKLGNRALTFLESRVLGFRLGEHRNYVLLPG